MEPTRQQTLNDASSDHDDRLEDFYARHGGPDKRENRESLSAGGDDGWSEVYAGDGYVLRCDWSIMGTRREMTYSEIPPGTSAAGPNPPHR